MILWLTGPNGYSAPTKALLLGVLKKHNIFSTDIIFNNLYHKVPSLGIFPKKKIPVATYITAARHALHQDCSILRPNLIIVNDEPTLRALTEQPYTLAQVRGSVYDFEGIPVIVLDNLKNLWAYLHGEWLFGLDLRKVIRFAHGKQNKLPAFNFTLAETPAQVRRFVDEAAGASACAIDIETVSGFISCIAYTYDFNGSLRTFCVPFYDPWQDDGCFWDENSERVVRRSLKELNANSVPKIFQNGMYDCAYLMEAGMPPVNYVLDTQYMMHSIWCEVPKALHEISSYFLDNYCYWKDDAKGVKEDGFGKTRDDILRYWRYNGLDAYYTYLSAKELTTRLRRLPWGMKNYDNSLSLALGPCLAASLRGLRVDPKRHSRIMRDQSRRAEAGLESLRRFVGEPDFNPSSVIDAPWALYDVLGAEVTRLQRKEGEKSKTKKYGPRSTDEKVLKLMKEQRNPLLNAYIRRHLEAKKPAAVLSKFGDMDQLCRNGRFLSWMSPTATTTSRFNSTGSQFWTGTNAQNLQQFIREMFIADDDYVFMSADYRASDDYFVAYESEDPDKIRVVNDSKDIHCYHASIFFSKPYEEVYRAYKAKAPWVVDSTVGIRQNTKRVVHGRNYLEQAGTMYNVMGRDAVVATAIALGYSRAEGFSDKQLIAICALLCDMYDHPKTGLYKRIRPWQAEICETLKKNGGLATTAFGFTRNFLGSIADHRTQRQLASFYGQGDTGGNINRALRKIWYSGIDDGKKCLFLLQVHDNLLFAIRKDSLPIIGEIKKIMEEPCVIHGRTMSVPTAPEVGLTWAEQMLPWKPSTTYAEIVAFEEATFAEKYRPETEAFTPLDDATLALLAEIEPAADEQEMELEDA